MSLLPKTPSLMDLVRTLYWRAPSQLARPVLAHTLLETDQENRGGHTLPFERPASPAVVAGAARAQEVRMTQLRSRLLVPTLALIALSVLFPALATALPQGEAVLPVAERQEATPGRLSQLWNLLSSLRAETGSILEPNGEPKPNAGSSGDSGSGLEPNG
jgi:hypothetical protein